MGFLSGDFDRRKDSSTVQFHPDGNLEVFIFIFSVCIRACGRPMFMGGVCVTGLWRPDGDVFLGDSLLTPASVACCLAPGILRLQLPSPELQASTPTWHLCRFWEWQI